MSISPRRRDVDRDALRDAAAYPLPFTAMQIKALDRMDQKAAARAAARRAVRDCRASSYFAVGVAMTSLWGCFF
jgi:hypothetical protein